MRDIRKELRERLTDVENKRIFIQKQLETLITQENSLKFLLTIENALWQQTAKPFPEMEVFISAPKSRTGSPLAQFIIDSLRNGNKSLNTLKEEVTTTNLIPEEKSKGRVLHFALVGMANANVVEKIDKVWRLKIGNAGSGEPASSV